MTVYQSGQVRSQEQLENRQVLEMEAICPVCINAMHSRYQLGLIKSMFQKHNVQNWLQTIYICTGQSCAIITVKLFCFGLQVLMSASFLGALCLFSSVCVVCAISAFTLPIETKGRALQVRDSGSS